MTRPGQPCLGVSPEAGPGEDAVDETRSTARPGSLCRGRGESSERWTWAASFYKEGNRPARRCSPEEAKQTRAAWHRGAGQEPVPQAPRTSHSPTTSVHASPEGSPLMVLAPHGMVSHGLCSGGGGGKASAPRPFRPTGQPASGPGQPGRWRSALRRKTLALALAS